MSLTRQAFLASLLVSFATAVSLAAPPAAAAPSSGPGASNASGSRGGGYRPVNPGGSRPGYPGGAGRHGGYGHSGHYGHYSHGHYGGYYPGWGWGVGIGLGVPWGLGWYDPWWGWGSYPSYGYGAAYPNYAYACELDEDCLRARESRNEPAAPTTEVPPAAFGAEGGPTQRPLHLNYCDSARAWFPQVRTCPGGWRLVRPEYSQ